jgi:hypothetical protein
MAAVALGVIDPAQKVRDSELTDFFAELSTEILREPEVDPAPESRVVALSSPG